MKNLDCKKNSSEENQGFLKLDPNKIEIKTDSIKDHFDVEHSPFARGKFATVRKCVHKETGVEYAAKFIRKRRRAVDVRHEILHEIAVLQKTESCPQIVNLIDVYETNSELILVLEMVAGGELQRIIDEEEVISEHIVIDLMKQILEGVSFLHQKNIAHLDIKPQNLLLTGPFPECSIKLCDFGISRLICGDVEIREIVGTPDYIAPEVLHYEPISVETDMWSIGILAYVLLSGHSPFGGDTKQETFCNITQSALEFPEELFANVSQNAIEFIKSVLIRDPKIRPSVQESMKHVWFNCSAKGSCQPESLESAISVSSENDSMASYSMSPPKETCADVLSSETSSMDSMATDSGGESSCSEDQTLVEQTSEMDTLSNTASSLLNVNNAATSSKSPSPVREIFNISADKSDVEISIDNPSSTCSRVNVDSPKEEVSASTPSVARKSEFSRTVFGETFRSSRFCDDNKENIRLTRTRVAPPPVIHSLSPSLNVRSGYVRSAITGFNSGRSMSTIGTSKSTLFSSSRMCSSMSTSPNRSPTSRRVKISSDETEIRINKTSVVVIDEGVYF